jgi:hypothetical protein
MGATNRNASSRSRGLSIGKRALSPPKKLVVRVGLSWRNDEQRWRSIWRPELKSIAEDATKRLRRAGFTVASDGAVEIRKLRATPGQYVFDAILEDIEEADVLVFDLTPREGELSGPANVLIEVGAALALERRVFLASESPGKVALLSSDLSGHQIGRVRRGKLDQSLRMAILNRILRDWRRGNAYG